MMELLIHLRAIRTSICSVRTLTDSYASKALQGSGEDTT